MKKYMLVIDDGTDYFDPVCRPALERYCERHGASLVVRRPEYYAEFSVKSGQFGQAHPAWALIPAIRQFADVGFAGGGEQICCFLDNDIYPHPKARSIWDRSPNSCPRNSYPTDFSKQRRMEILRARGIRELAQDNDLQTCCITLDRDCARVVSAALNAPWDSTPGQVYEQEFIAYRLWRCKVRLGDVHRWNITIREVPRIEPFDRRADFYHAAGSVKPGKLHYLSKFRDCLDLGQPWG